MEVNETNKQQIVRQHTTAGCLSGGCRLLADNIWTLLRASWPLLTVCALWGIIATVMLRPGIYTFPCLVALLTAGVILDLLWLGHTTVLLRRFQADGQFPPTRPLRQATTLWRGNMSSAWSALGRACLLILRRPRRWPALIAIVFVGKICIVLAAMVVAMPFFIISLVQLQAGAAAMIGDAANLPSYLTWLSPLADAVAVPTVYVISWMMLFPLAFFVGSLYADDSVKNSIGKAD